jgi:hypothetical protein
LFRDFACWLYILSGSEEFSDFFELFQDVPGEAGNLAADSKYPAERQKINCSMEIFAKSAAGTGSSWPHPWLFHVGVVEPQDVLVGRRADDLDPPAGDLADAGSGAEKRRHEVSALARLVRRWATVEPLVSPAKCQRLIANRIDRGFGPST